MAVISIDLGGTRIKTGVVNGDKIYGLVMQDISSKDGLSKNLELIKSHIEGLLNEFERTEIAGIGLAFPGLVDTQKNCVIDTSKKYDDAPAIDIAGWAWQEFGLQLRIENDARLACLGEWRYGAGVGKSNMVMCTIGTGIGSAVIMDDKMVRGKHFQAGVLGGHTIIDYSNRIRKCSCGNYGCVEAMASNWMIEELAKSNKLYEKSKLNDVSGIDLATVFELAAGEDELAMLLRNHCMNVWSSGIINLIHAYDPEVVVIGGGVMHSAEVILPFFKSHIAERAWCPSGLPEIYTALYPDTAALLGASLLFEHVEKNNRTTVINN
jgi:glucokinase